jgi:hypothetical protein
MSTQIIETDKTGSGVFLNAGRAQQYVPASRYTQPLFPDPIHELNDARSP